METSGVKDQFQAAKIYTNFRGLDEVREGAKAHSQEALEEVAQQMESIFLQMVLKSMREANNAIRSDFLETDHTDFYQEMYHQQLALNLSSKGVGLSKSIVKQLSKHYVTDEAKADIKIGNLVPPLRSELNPSSIPAIETKLQADLQSKQEPDKDAAVAEEQNDALTSARAFVNELLPHAQAVASGLGIDPKLLVAQAALETGWGRSLPQGTKGENSFNLFGIKAHNWQGDKVATMTHEFRDGKFIKQVDTFRQYTSYSESFNDYLQFLTTNPRYAKALTSSQDPRAFANALQDAGYATDPRYAEKIMDLYRSPAISEAKISGKVNKE